MPQLGNQNLPAEKPTLLLGNGEGSNSPATPIQTHHYIPRVGALSAGMKISLFLSPGFVFTDILPPRPSVKKNTQGCYYYCSEEIPRHSCEDLSSFSVRSLPCGHPDRGCFYTTSTVFCPRRSRPSRDGPSRLEPSSRLRTSFQPLVKLRLDVIWAHLLRLAY